jgi:hypothetical protein
MIRVKIIKNGIQTHEAQFNTKTEADAWIAEGSAQQWWGKPAYTEVIPAVKESKEVVITPEVCDENGNVITPAVTKTQEVIITPETTIKHPAEFEVVIEDITAEVEAWKAIDESIKFLSETDWMVIRQVETGISVPIDILNQRAAARAIINEKRQILEQKQ